MRKTWKRAIAVLLVCLAAFSVMQMTAFAAFNQPDSVGTVIGQGLGAIVFAPFYVVRFLFAIISAPFQLLFG
ncbi:MAG: hypothetical protein IJT41_10805 [Clostridia bacterium]|nr:hypothetical protein [Clostridia bacterium]